MAKTRGITIREHFENTGNWLFMRRRWLPLVCMGVILVALRSFKFPYGSHRLDQLWEMFCLAISLLGLSVRIVTVGYIPEGTSGRNTRGQKANVLNTTGMYSLVRHPLYWGNFLIWLGVSLFARIWWLSVLLLLAFWLYYERVIFAEEEYLQRKFGRQFDEWASQTHTFFPRFGRWKRPDLSFSIRMVLKREHSTLFIIIVYYAMLEQAASLITTGSLELDPLWLVLFVIGLAQYMLLRILKKHTRLLHTTGR